MNSVINVKPHVKQFLINQCGEDPTDLKLLPQFWKLYIEMLKKPCYHQDSKNIGNYSEQIIVKISDDIFYRYGWEISKTDTVAFNNQVDDFIKLISRQYISIHVNFGVKQIVASRKFCELFDFGNSLDPDSVVKDFYRNRPTANKNNLYSSIFKQIENNFLVNLGVNGMISQYFINNNLTLNDI